MYYETANLPNFEIKSAKNIEAQISQLMLASWHSYGISTKFLAISSDKGNIIPMVNSESNSLLKQKINDYEKLIRPGYIIPSSDLAILEFARSKEFEKNLISSSSNHTGGSI
jgi:hypothetical protein